MTARVVAFSSAAIFLPGIVVMTTKPNGDLEDRRMLARIFLVLGMLGLVFSPLLH